MKQSKTPQKWYNERKWAAILAVVALVAAYGMGSRALFTGSLQQYVIMFALLFFSINRFAHILLTSVRKFAR